MAVELTDLDIGTRYALKEDFDNGFVGRDRQVVIQTDDPKGYRPVIMDGQYGIKNRVALLEDIKRLDAYAEMWSNNFEPDFINGGLTGGACFRLTPEHTISGEETSDYKSIGMGLVNYQTKAYVSPLLRFKEDRLSIARHNEPDWFSVTLSTGDVTIDGKKVATVDQIPDTSQFATNDDLSDLQSQISDRYSNYGILPEDATSNTYVTVQQLQSTTANLSDYAGAQGQLVYNTDTKKFHVMDGTTVGGSSVLATEAQVGIKINLSGNRGNPSGYETIDPYTVNTIKNEAYDSGTVTSNVTINNGTTGTSWVKFYQIDTDLPFVANLGSNWVWANGETPTVSQGDFLVCAWCNTNGIVSVVKRTA